MLSLGPRAPSPAVLRGTQFCLDDSSRIIAGEDARGPSEKLIIRSQTHALPAIDRKK